MNRLSRWIRGDWQITSWLDKNSPLNLLSKYKIFDNLVSAITPIFIVILLIIATILSIIQNSSMWELYAVAILAIFIPTVIDVVNKIIYRKEV